MSQRELQQLELERNQLRAQLKDVHQYLYNMEPQVDRLIEDLAKFHGRLIELRELTK